MGRRNWPALYFISLRIILFSYSLINRISVPQPDVTHTPRDNPTDNATKAADFDLFSTASSSMTVDEPPMSSSRRLTNSPASFVSKNLDESSTSIASASTCIGSEHLDKLAGTKTEGDIDEIFCTSTPKVPADFRQSTLDTNAFLERPFRTVSPASCTRFGLLDESSVDVPSYIRNSPQPAVEQFLQNNVVDEEESIKEVLTTDSTQTATSSTPSIMNTTRTIARDDIASQQAVTREEFTALRKQVEELAKENSLLTDINEALAQTIMDLKSNADSRQRFENEILKTLIPAPVCLKYQRRGDDSLVITWENIIPLLSMVKGYEVSLNGVPSGIVTARHKRLVVTEISPDERYKLSIGAISNFNNLRSVEATLLIPKMEEDENENKENMTN